MKICIVSTLRPYNEARLYDRQALLWAKRGHEVHVVARNLGESLEQLPSGIRVTRLKSNLRGWSRRLCLGWRAMRRVETIQPDVVHYHDPELHFWLPQLGRRGTKVVYDARENHPFLIVHRNQLKVPQVSALFGRIFWNLEERVLRRAFLVTVTTGLADIYKALNRPIVTVMNFASRHAFIPREPAPEPIMVCGGTLNEDRGLTEMLELLARVRARVPNVRLILCGAFTSAKLKSSVLSYARKFGIESSLEILGQRSHREYVNMVLSRARLGISITPPNAQNDCAFPVRLGEYWAAGLPTVCNDLPEIQRIWDEDPFFSMFRYGDMDSLQKIAEEYLLDYDAARTAGRIARQRVDEIYNGEMEFDNLEKFYRSVILSA